MHRIGNWKIFVDIPVKFLLSRKLYSSTGVPFVLRNYNSGAYSFHRWKIENRHKLQLDLCFIEIITHYVQLWYMIYCPCCVLSTSLMKREARWMRSQAISLYMLHNLSYFFPRLVWPRTNQGSVHIEVSQLSKHVTLHLGLLYIRHGHEECYYEKLGLLWYRWSSTVKMHLKRNRRNCCFLSITITPLI